MEFSRLIHGGPPRGHVPGADWCTPNARRLATYAAAAAAVYTCIHENTHTHATYTFTLHIYMRAYRYGLSPQCVYRLEYMRHTLRRSYTAYTAAYYTYIYAITTCTYSTLTRNDLYARRVHTICQATVRYWFPSPSAPPRPPRVHRHTHMHTRARATVYGISSGGAVMSSLVRCVLRIGAVFYSPHAAVKSTLPVASDGAARMRDEYYHLFCTHTHTHVFSTTM